MWLSVATRPVSCYDAFLILENTGVFQPHSPMQPDLAEVIKQEPLEDEASPGIELDDQPPLKKIKQEVLSITEASMHWGV